MTQNRDYIRNKIKGALVGGAIGDALGYAIEFSDEDSIFSTYGPDGIHEYELDEERGKALVSDDTQMSLFTANGILLGGGRETVGDMYEEWLKTQRMSYSKYQAYKRDTDDYCQKSWLMDVPELFADRAPGLTCLSAISEGMGSVEVPANDSKGCGGVMRVAPVGLRYRGDDMEKLDMEGAEIAALTHGHSMSHMSSAMLVHIVNRLVYGETSKTLSAIIEDALDTVTLLFDGDEHLEKFKALMNLAVILSENSDDDLSNIHRLGEGWIAEETLAIALYCSLKYQDNFSRAITVSVNHKGDSDSTGAVTGNIIGALLGYDEIEPDWIEDLELVDVIERMADELSNA